MVFLNYLTVPSQETVNNLTF